MCCCKEVIIIIRENIISSSACNVAGFNKLAAKCDLYNLKVLSHQEILIKVKNEFAGNTYHEINHSYDTFNGYKLLYLTCYFSLCMSLKIRNNTPL